ncbi:MAG: phosphatidylserine/phosphatidylglycerophosphate/cardiolipin synthase family protein [Patescibacteria group bacterium]
MNLTFQFNASDIWRAQLADCSSARLSIDFETWIFTDTNSGIGRDFLDVFREKVREGVRVRILLDMYGSLGMYVDFALLKELREAGIEIAFFNPIAFWRLHKLFSWFSRRDHRKLILIDNRIVHIGSACVAERMRDWHESSVRILAREGELITPIINSFNQLWHSVKRMTLSRKAFDLPLTTSINYISSTPHIGKRKIHHALSRAIRRAKKNIFLVTPYFVPTERLQFALFRALKRGVRVRLIIPEKSDPRLVDLAAYEYARSLVRRGAEVLLHPDMVHSKYSVIDGEWGMLGSANLDNLSLLSDYEHVIAGTDSDLVSPLLENFNILSKEAKVFGESQMHPPIHDRLLGLLARPIHRFL